MALPIGFGLRYAINTQWRIGLQAGYRFTTTDYLDDVSGVGFDASDLEKANPGSSAYANPGLTPRYWEEGQQRGDATDRDGYMFAQFQVHYKLVKKKKYGRGSRIKTRKSMPSF